MGEGDTHYARPMCILSNVGCVFKVFFRGGGGRNINYARSRCIPFNVGCVFQVFKGTKRKKDGSLIPV